MYTEQEVLSKIYRYCAMQERSPAEIRRRLIQLCDDEMLAKSFEEHLFKHDFVNEKRFAELFVRGKTSSRKWGKVKLSDALRKHGISETVIAEALRNLPQSDYTDMMRKEILKKWNMLKEPDDTKKKAKLIRFGLQRGYSYQDIMLCLKHQTSVE